MPRFTTKLTRLAVTGMSVGALLPAAAGAMPINDGHAPAQPVAGPTTLITGGGDVVSAGDRHHALGLLGPGSQTTPSKPSTGGGDVVSGGGYHLQTTPSKPFTGGGDVVSGGGYRFKAVPSDSGIDTGVLVAMGVGILVALGAWFLLVATKRRTRERRAA